MTNLFDFAFTVHFTDREDIDVMCYVKDKILPMREKTLVVEQKEMMKAFSSAFRICKFKKMIFRCDPKILQMFCPLQQYGWVVPNHIVCSEDEPGDLTVSDVEEKLGLKSAN